MINSRDLKIAMSEFFGTFFIVFVSCWSITSYQKNQLDLFGLGLANGLITSICIWAGMEASGSHFNPIITMIKLAIGKFSLIKALAYVVIQLMASCVASLLALLLAPPEFQQKITQLIGHPQKSPQYTDFQVFIFEFIGSMIYCFMYFAMVIDKRAPLNVFGFAIGSVIAVCTFAFGPATGACVNPIRVFGAEVILSLYDDAGTYWFSTVSGGIFIAFYYNAFILKNNDRSYEVVEEMVKNNMESPENLNQALGLKY